jgi:hypothetical protein
MSGILWVYLLTHSEAQRNMLPSWSCPPGSQRGNLAWSAPTMPCGAYSMTSTQWLWRRQLLGARFEQYSRCFEVSRLEAFGEPLIHVCQPLTGCGAFALPLP